MSFMTQEGVEALARHQQPRCRVRPNIADGKKHSSAATLAPPPPPTQTPAFGYSDSLGSNGSERKCRKKILTDSVDSREPDDCVSRLLRLLERRRGEGGGEAP